MVAGTTTGHAGYSIEQASENVLHTSVKAQQDRLILPRRYSEEPHYQVRMMRSC